LTIREELSLLALGKYRFGYDSTPTEYHTARSVGGLSQAIAIKTKLGFHDFTVGVSMQQVV
jgi:hypothetical protein